MSWDVSLIDPVTKEPLYADFTHQISGGTYAIGGTTEMWLSITYNYSRWYYRDDVFDSDKGIKVIEGVNALESIPIIQKAISSLTSLDEDIPRDELNKMKQEHVSEYWIPTRENAIKPLHQLIAFAKIRPDGIWEVT